MKAFLKNNFAILFLYITAVTVALFFICNYEKATIHIYLNQFVGNKLLNNFFYYITYLGDGAIAPFLLLGLLIYNIRLGIYATVSFLTAALTAQFLKHFFFDDVNRPWFIFQWENHFPIRYVDGVEKYIHNSFPSGHATQAFAIFMCLIFFTKNHLLKFVFFGLAMGTSLSRVYLSQHWLVDITVGSIIGTVFSLLWYFLFIQKNKLEKLNKPLFNFKRS
ncbi:MAG: phosphatase PAP2 family protein [Bacteroidia bacterium]